MKPLSVTFLGTCSGGGPLLSRACTSTMLNIDHAQWLIDCAEGTQIQLKRAKFKPELISKVFITHMHVDHVMGLIPLMRTVMNKDEPTSTRLRMHIYGPYGLRKFVRVNLQLTLTELRGRYAVHELLGPSDEPSISCETDLLHVNENPGSDIRPNEQGLWRNVVSDKDWTVHAGPLQHRAPAVGYVFQEEETYTYRPEHYVPQIQRNMHHLRTETTQDSYVQESIPRRVIGHREPVSLPHGTALNPPPTDVPGRKIVILGDTYDSRGIIPLCYDASLLVHEATQMAIPQDLARRVSQFRKGCSEEEARKAALKHGHSTAAMAGEFARDIRAKRLFLNHFSVKLSLYGARDDPHRRDRSPQRSNNKKRRYDILDDIMTELENQASAAWGLGRAIATSDLQTVYIPWCDPPTPEIQGALSPSPSMAIGPSNRA